MPRTIALLVALAVLSPDLGAQCASGTLIQPDAILTTQFPGDVAIDGKHALVGAAEGTTDYEGWAAFFERTPQGWQHRRAFSMPNGEEFGESVALFDDLAVVSAPTDGSDPNEDGSVWVFRLIDGDWRVEAKIEEPKEMVFHSFGAAVAVHNRTIVVGAPATADEGTAFIYEQVNGTWTLRKELKVHGAITGYYGSAVAIEGDRVVVGDHRYMGAPTWSTGAVSVFERDSGGDWFHTTNLLANDASNLDLFGLSIALSGDQLLVGAYTEGAYGSAYLFEHSDGAWSQAAKLTPEGFLGASDTFAFDVDLELRTAAMSWPEEDRAVVFQKKGSTWLQFSEVLVDDAWTVSLSDDVLLVEDQIFELGTCLESPVPGTAGSANVLQVVEAPPGAWIAFGVGLTAGTIKLSPPCGATTLELDQPLLLGLVQADASGQAALSADVPVGAVGVEVYLQGLDITSCQPTNLVWHQFL